MLKAKNLSRSFGSKTALDKLNISVSAGEILCLLGANGAGKTTTINLFLGFLSPSSGSASVNGLEVSNDVTRARSQLAYVPEQVNLYPSLSGLENLQYFTRLAGKDSSEARLRQYLDQMALDPDAADLRVESYSKGMRQKVGLAIALAKDAKALLLDEPLSGLDPKAANEFCQLLRKLAFEQKTAVLMATHDLFRAKDVGDQIGIMKAGRLVAHRMATELSHSQLEQLYLDHMQNSSRTHTTDCQGSRVTASPLGTSIVGGSA
jgi:ABC-2 type transport system ATP-binding protein